jgi:hypothetical protein
MRTLLLILCLVATGVLAAVLDGFESTDHGSTVFNVRLPRVVAR